MRRRPVVTAPATTLPTISTDMTRPSTPNATRNGTNSAVSRVATFFTPSQDCAPVRESAGTVAVIAARSRVSWAVVAAWVKR